MTNLDTLKIQCSKSQLQHTSGNPTHSYNLLLVDSVARKENESTNISADLTAKDMPLEVPTFNFCTIDFAQKSFISLEHLPGSDENRSITL